MSPTPKEVDSGYRRPLESFFQEIGEKTYPWLEEHYLKCKKGILIDSESPEGLCVHLVAEWWREEKLHRCVLCEDDFEEVRRLEAIGESEGSVLNLERSEFMVDWSKEIGKRIYQRYTTPSGINIYGAPSELEKISSFTYRELEEGFLRAAGRLKS